MNTYTRKELAVDLSRLELQGEARLSQVQSAAVIDYVIDTITAKLAGGTKVDIRGFGAFTPKLRPARKSNNALMGGNVTIPARTVAAFRMSVDLKRKLNSASTGAVAAK